jgi:hypothetical protein
VYNIFITSGQDALKTSKMHVQKNLQNLYSKSEISRQRGFKKLIVCSKWQEPLKNLQNVYFESEILRQSFQSG